jgi:hypothetical protein
MNTTTMNWTIFPIIARKAQMHNTYSHENDITGYKAPLVSHPQMQYAVER